MKTIKCLVAVVILTMTCLSFCNAPYSSTPAEADLTDLLLCRGQTAKGDPITLQQPVPLSETNICICGHLRTNRDWDITLQVLWSYEGEMLQVNPQKFSDGPFTSCIEQKGGFEPGEYGVSVIIYKTTIGDMDFVVGE